MADVHHRMPVILAREGQTWLGEDGAGADQLQALFQRADPTARAT
jgi:putative SOS response-associated peptidase YedK